MKIDLVYTYVNGQDINIKKKRNMFLRDEYVEYNPEIRYESINEIYYSVKSAIKFLDFINKIYIVTDKQIPNLNEIQERVIIVDHTDIIPLKYLPTFNSDVIESFLHNIPNLSDVFLYNNDDCFFLDYLKINDIISECGNLNIINNFNINILKNKTSEYAKRIVYTYDLIKLFFPQSALINNHHTKILRVNTLKYLEQLFSEDLDMLRINKFRTLDTIQYLFLAINMDNILRNNNVLNTRENFLEYHFGNCDYSPELKSKFSVSQHIKFACFNSMNESFKVPFCEYINQYLQPTQPTDKAALLEQTV